MNKQTAIEWLGVNLNALFLDISSELWEEAEAIFQQAKILEKEQIEDAFQDGKWDWADHITEGKPSKDLAQYYKEIYGKEE